MNIIIVGSGKVGRALTRQLARENHDVVVIDRDPQVIEDLINAFDVNGICGNGACYDIQKQAGVEKADLLISVTQTDELNILCCMLAKKMGCHHSIARVRTPEYSKQLDFMRTGFGISMLVNPEYLAANEIARILRFPSAIKLEPFANGRVELADIIISEGNDLIGKPVHIIHEKYRVSVLVCAVKRGDQAIIPNGDFIIKQGDRISVTASRPELVNFMKKLGLYRTRTNRVMIAGGGNVGYYLAKQLTDSGHTVKVIEKKEVRALELGDILPGSEIINGDATEREILNEQGLAHQDAFVALMGRDEENAIISMYAKSQHIGKVVTKASRISTDVLSSIGLDSVVSAQELATDRILSYVRALHNSEGTGVRTLYRIVDGKAEALEFGVPNDFAYNGVVFRDLRLKKNLIIACIIRRNKVIFPRGGDCLEAGDTVIVVTSIESLRTLADIVE
jgi:K+ transport systems, NAD-binding component